MYCPKGKTEVGSSECRSCHRWNCPFAGEVVDDAEE